MFEVIRKSYPTISYNLACSRNGPNRKKQELKKSDFGLIEGKFMNSSSRLVHAKSSASLFTTARRK